MSPKTFTETEQGRRSGDVELIWAKNSKTFFFANSLVIHGTSPIIVDPSANFTYFERMSATGSAVRVLNTHYHTDHRALNGLFRQATFLCHRADAPALRSWDRFQEYIDRDPNSPYSDWVKRLWQQMNMHDTPVTIELDDGDVIDSDSHQIRIQHIPGHTPGHIGLYFPDISFLFTSDIDLTPMGPWYANEVSDIEQFRQSIAKVRAIEVTHYATSHGQRIYDREQFLTKLDRFSAVIDRRDEKILDALEKGSQSVASLAERGIIYRTAQMGDPLRKYFAARMIEKHLALMIKKGVIEQDGERYHLKA